MSFIILSQKSNIPAGVTEQFSEVQKMKAMLHVIIQYLKASAKKEKAQTRLPVLLVTPKMKSIVTFQVLNRLFTSWQRMELLRCYYPRRETSPIALSCTYTCTTPAP